MAKRVSEHLAAWGVSEESASGEHEVLAIIRSTAMLGQSWGFDLVLIDGNGMESRLAELLADIRAIESLRKLQLVIALRSESLAQRIKRDYDVFVLGDDLRPEPLRRLLHRLFDVESRKYGTQSLKPEEVYDDLNLAAADLAPVPVEPLKPIGRDAPRVLLVEDNPVNQGVVGKALSLLGMDCDMAENGKDAVERCHLVHFDLIFMDCQMLVMDGYEAAGEIRRWEHANRITRTPIVAMTANAMAGDREKCLQAGMDDYLAKPVSMAQLKGCLESWLPSASTSPRSGDLAVSSVVPEEVKEEPMLVLDDTVLEELREVMQEDYVGLLMTYVGNSPDLVEELRQATARQDIEAMVIPMHSLKSSSANVGAVAVSELARQGEAYARAGDLGAASRVVPELEKAFATALRALREHISDYQAG